MPQDIGFIGVGKMGEPMAKRLLAADHRVHVFDARQSAVDAIVAKGGVAARTPAEVASKAETVLVSLPTPDIVKQVALGPEGVIAGTGVKTYVDLSTTGPRVAAEVAAALAAKGIASIDAPVSGGVGGAEKGTLSIMVSGPHNLCGALRPMFEVLGKYFYIGAKPGMGQLMKLCNNMLSAITLAASSEIMTLGVKGGLDPNVMVEVINVSSGGNTALRDKFPKSILPRSFDYGFATGLMYKDVRLCLDEAEGLNTPMYLSAVVRQVFNEANARFGGDSDFTNIVRLFEEAAGGVEVKAGPKAAAGDKA
jgi:3-hydroxyisobutyrate dehydrogenase-like beta-hydroxyacid dehydrogenase